MIEVENKAGRKLEGETWQPRYGQQVLFICLAAAAKQGSQYPQMPWALGPGQLLLLRKGSPPPLPIAGFNGRAGQ